MSVEVKIPTVGESITSGVISVWHKADGEAVSKGETLLTLDTDKVSTDLTAEESGTIHLLAQVGEEVSIGQVVATIELGATQVPATPAAQKATPAKKSPPASAPPPSPTTSTLRSAVEGANVALGVLQHTPTAPSPSYEERISRKKLTPLRRKIAAQLVMAQHQAAILTTFNECDMSAVMKLRAEMQEAFAAEHGVKLGFMSFFIKAAVSALRAVPSVNARLDGDELVSNHYFDIGVAVGTDRGLMVPVVRDADQLSFAGLEKAMAAYAVKAREGKIEFQDLQGGVFTISNGGIYGSLLSTPILNPPQSGILGMHKIQERPVAVKGQVVIRPMMYLALSYDHRIVDGKEAVTFLVRVKDCIENPTRLMLGL
ncbi:MAG: dihydrolipoyllysine-residue succinyltransferase [Proteobacteria bacterium]|nr:dihydrolipoyllysine-residue succinyltransferase [Pseudomonadota bacterium]